MPCAISPLDRRLSWGRDGLMASSERQAHGSPDSPHPAPKKGAAGPQAPSKGHDLLQLRIHQRRRQLGPELAEHLIHKLTEPGEGAIGAGLAEGKGEAGIGTLQPAAAVEVRMAERVRHEWRSARPSQGGGAGSRTRVADPARSLRPPHKVGGPGRSPVRGTQEPVAERSDPESSKPGGSPAPREPLALTSGRGGRGPGPPAAAAAAGAHPASGPRSAPPDRGV